MPNPWVSRKTKQASHQSDFTLTRQFCPSVHLNGISRPCNMLLQKAVPPESLVTEAAGCSQCKYLSTDNATSHSTKQPYSRLQSLKIHFYISLPSMPTSSKYFLQTVFSNQTVGTFWTTMKTEATTWHLSTCYTASYPRRWKSPEPYTELSSVP